MRSHLPVGKMWALVQIAPCRMQIAMPLLMGRTMVQWLESMGSTGAGGEELWPWLMIKWSGGSEEREGKRAGQASYCLY
jgi:hypothetical protein